MQNNDESKICLGAIAGAHGVNGEVKIKTFTEKPEDIAAYGMLTTETGDRSFSILGMRTDKLGVVARIDGVNDRDTAQNLKGTRLYVKRNALPEVDEETWYHADLIGLSVKGKDNEQVGVITAVHDFGAGDIIEVAPIAGGGSVFVPFTREAVPTVDVKQGFIVTEFVKTMADDNHEDETGRVDESH